MRVSGCQYLPGPGGHSAGPGLRLTRGPGPRPGACPGITDEIEVFRLGAGVVGRPGSTRGDSLPTLKVETNVSPRLLSRSTGKMWCKKILQEENMEIETLDRDRRRMRWQ